MLFPTDTSIVSHLDIKGARPTSQDRSLPIQLQCSVTLHEIQVDGNVHLAIGAVNVRGRLLFAQRLGRIHS
jgi:hypothetical protein